MAKIRQKNHEFIWQIPKGNKKYIPNRKKITELGGFFVPPNETSYANTKKYRSIRWLEFGEKND